MMNHSLPAIVLLFIGSNLWSATPTSNAPFLKPEEAIAKMDILLR